MFFGKIHGVERDSSEPTSFLYRRSWKHHIIELKRAKYKKLGEMKENNANRERQCKES